MDNTWLIYWSHKNNDYGVIKVPRLIPVDNDEPTPRNEY
jgi:hypothetical protein